MIFSDISTFNLSPNALGILDRIVLNSDEITQTSGQFIP